MDLYNKWIHHLDENNINYIQHMIFAVYYGSLCILAGIYLLIHSILPCFFQTAGSDLVNNLSERFKKRNYD